MTEIFIENTRADIDAAISALLTFALDDVQDFGARNTAWSKTIVMPGTARNNKLFGHIFDVRSANEYDPATTNINYNFNPAKKAAVQLFVDQIQTFKGWLRLLEIRIDGGAIEYEVAMFGELYGLIQSIGRNKLEDLDFSAYDHDYTIANIEASWDDYNAGAGYYYPLIDYGQSYGIQPGVAQQKHNWQYKTFRPALFAKEYIDKIFEQAGFTYDCSLFATERFKRLIIPHNQKELSGYSNSGFAASPTVKTYNSTGFGFALELGTITQLGNFTSSFGDTRFTYGGASQFNCTANITIAGLWKSPVQGAVELRINGTTIRSYSIGTGGSFRFFSAIFTESVTFNNGDYFEVYFLVNNGVSAAYNLDIMSGSVALTTVAGQLVPINLGEQVPVNEQIPKNVLQRDFFVSILKLFNLYVYDDKYKANHVVIAPYVDFYSTDVTAALDWTYKVDRARPLRIIPMSELNSRFYNFKFKPDTDYYNDLYKKRYSEGYGDRVFDTDFDFEDSSKDVEVIFSATPLVGYQGEDKVYSTILKISSDIEEAIDSNIRILQAFKVTGVTSWDVLNVDTVLDSFDVYPYAGHLDDPDAPSNDLNFGAPQELFFTVTNGNITANQFNVYWSSYMAEITDKNSKLLKCWVKLDVLDVLQLDFSKLIWIDGALWRLNKMEDFNMTNPEAVMCEFLKVIEITY